MIPPRRRGGWAAVCYRINICGGSVATMPLQRMTQTAMFTALTAVLSQVSFPLPFSPVPLTLQTFAVFFTSVLLGSKKGALAIVLYVFIGLIGLPVFAQGKGGLPVLVGPTGGYLMGFVLGAWVTGKITELRGEMTFQKNLGAVLAGGVIIYTLGMVQLKVLLGLSFREAFFIGVLPYLALEGIKAVLAAYLALVLKKALSRAFPQGK